MSEKQIESVLVSFPPMGVYEVLFKFKDACGLYLGTDDTHPYAQGIYFYCIVLII